ncbi:MAG: MauE/DoxX family redox-associated membrane protein [Phycisphaerae bacterium]
MADSSSHKASPQRRITAFDVVRVFLGLVLLTAAVLKTHELATRPAKNLNILSYRWSLALLVQVQIFLGLWWVSGLYKRLAWLSAVVCFAFFTGVTIYEGLAGYESCGCFGAVKVHPWHTLVFDLLGLAALLVFRPKLSRPHPVTHSKPRHIAVAAVMIVGGFSAAAAIAGYEPARLEDTGEIVSAKNGNDGNDREVVVLQPHDWLGKTFPLLKHIDVGDKLRSGQWEVILYHYTCPTCREEIERIEQLAQMRGGWSEAGGVAVVSIPPHAPAGEEIVPDDTACLRGKLSDEHDWFVSTPVMLTLTDGVVTEVRGGGSGSASDEDQTRDSEPDTNIHPTAAAGEPPVITTEVNPVTGDWRAEHDFGVLPTNSQASVILRVENTTEDEIVLRRVKSGCDCSALLSIPHPPERIAAGRTVHVRIVLTTPDTPRRVAEWASLWTTGENPKKIVARIVANVVDATAANADR